MQIEVFLIDLFKHACKLIHWNSVLFVLGISAF